MTRAQALQFFGGICEFGGIIFVAIGITRTREAFTNERSTIGKIADRLRLFYRLLRGKPATVPLEPATALSTSFGKAELRRRFHWQGSLGERVAEVQNLVQEHEDFIADLQHKTAHLEDDFERAIKEEREERETMRQALEDRIREAAAGGLKLQARGAVLFMFGLIFATWGNLIS
jgi:hypothetical protein